VVLMLGGMGEFLCRVQEVGEKQDDKEWVRKVGGTRWVIEVGDKSG